MSAVHLIQSVSGALYMLTISVVGFRMLMLARRTRGLPELFLGCSLLVGGTLGAGTEAAAYSAMDQVAPSRVGWLLIVGKVIALSGLLGQVLFVWWVFRRDAPWGLWMVFGLTLLPVLSILAFLHNGTWQSGHMPTWICAVEFIGRAGGSVWMLTEALAYWAKLRRRARLGLADPVVTNRFLLWSMAGACGLIMLATSLPPVLVSDSHSDSSWLALDLVVFALAGVATSLLYWLTFLPPASYLGWIQSTVAEA